MARRPRDRPFPVISLAIALFAVHLLASDLAVATDAVVHSPDSPIVPNSQTNALVQERKAPTSDDQPSEPIPAEYASLVEQMQSLKHLNEATTMKLVKLATALRLMIRAIGAAGPINRNAAQSRRKTHKLKGNKGNKGNKGSNKDEEKQELLKEDSFDHNDPEEVDGQKKKPSTFNKIMAGGILGAAIGAVGFAIVKTFSWVAGLFGGGSSKEKEQQQAPPQQPQPQQAKEAEESDRSVQETQVNQIDSTVDETLNLAKNLVPADRSLSTQFTASEKRLDEIYASIYTLLDQMHSVNSRNLEGADAKKVAAAAGDRLDELFAEAEEEMTKMRALCERSGERCL